MSRIKSEHIWIKAERAPESLELVLFLPRISSPSLWAKLSNNDKSKSHYWAFGDVSMYAVLEQFECLTSSCHLRDLTIAVVLWNIRFWCFYVALELKHREAEWATQQFISVRTVGLGKGAGSFELSTSRNLELPMKRESLDEELPRWSWRVGMSSM